jgi:hypothetical protein
VIPALCLIIAGVPRPDSVSFAQAVIARAKHAGCATLLGLQVANVRTTEALAIAAPETCTTEREA